MAETYTKEELIEIYRGLPEEIKDAIFSPATTDIFDAIKEKQSLTAEQREVMSVYTGFLMMGVLPPEKYVSTLIEKMGIEREKVASIAQEINRDLFNPIKDVLKEIHSEKKNAPTTSQPAPVIQTQVRIGEKTAKATGTPFETVAAPRATPRMTDSRLLSKDAPPVPTQPINTAPVSTLAQKETPSAPAINTQGETMQPHIGSIFEQKLGGAFRLKSDAVAYTNQQSGEGVIPPSSSSHT